ncbi:MAG: 4-hydroxythreonine-4-phosphate dehydrogenase PdxA [Armatimonadota bacterium]|nr:4-hydroxythreonine-4-phosphate dehydrogenase PdxA [Armatimonadota bacterium]MDR7452138.1 4-hydroxythreonine-4-phosphate dehydrogenase PdxA [Armatimonadota bacterium]MDR7467862.1 4-hydroxythreonine-4-phosphate dehydrogenase PdxA [Armatimonadota bacterium]MDR7494750.1 4-hydroxythreonine-4-phosphate dehydrogenase PdxA [Armatimonadota bacterium]MDR7499575.1 4-hydroxythreonine-4-phosphate dehydrogenase PdxA [Armatimonadota bacterium]
MVRLAAVIGDPTGIGPEVLAKALADPPEDALLLVGDARVWEQARGVARLPLPPRPAVAPEPVTADGVPFLDVPADDRTWTIGEMSPAAGRAAGRWMETAVRLALRGAVDAVVFAPLNKQALIRAGHAVRDEYEFVARLAGVEEYDEMNVIPHPAAPDSGRLLWVARATSHIPLREVAPQITRERVLRAIRLAHRVATRAGGRELRIGVAALNPHAGEGGLIGDEEEHAITPAVVAAITEGINAMGPIPADHVFRLARAGRFDVVVSMYHDQAQIATKLLGFEMGVSVGVGLSFVLTTPSHGTAFDIAGRGVADPRPMARALRIASLLARGADERRKKPAPSGG